MKHPTLFQPDNKSAAASRKALLRFTKDVAGTVIDDIVWDMGERNAYSSMKGFVKDVEGGRLLIPTGGNPNDNKGDAPPMVVNQPYLKGFYGARYTENLNYDPNSASNQWARALGLNQQGTMTSTVSMYANKYPWKESLSLFGAMKGYGTQLP